MDTDIGSESRFLPTPPAFDGPRPRGSRRNIAIPFGVEPDGELTLNMLFVSTEFMNVTDGRTDGQTPHDGRGRAYA